MTRHRARRPDSSLTTTVSPPFSSETTVWRTRRPHSGLLSAPKKRACQGGQSLVSVFAAHQEQLSTGDLLDITSAQATWTRETAAQEDSAMQPSGFTSCIFLLLSFQSSL